MDRKTYREEMGKIQPEWVTILMERIWDQCPYDRSLSSYIWFYAQLQLTLITVVKEDEEPALKRLYKLLEEFGMEITKQDRKQAGDITEYRITCVPDKLKQFTKKVYRKRLKYEDKFTKENDCYG